MIKVKTEEYPTTTRRYPRTLKEAFPNDPEHSQWLYEPDTRWCGWDYILMVVLALLWTGAIYFMVYIRSLDHG